MSTRPELEVTPDPTAEERAAIEAAVAEAYDRKAADAAPAVWWKAGIVEATEESEDL